MANPWAHSRTEDQRDVPNVAVQQMNAYAVPSLNAGDAYITAFGWAPRLAPRTSTVETPSAQRLATIKRYDYYDDPQKPSDQFRADLDVDRRTRYRVEDQDADGWTIPSGLSQGDRRWADNPRRDPPPEPRLTSRLGPRTYSFTRPFDQLNRNYDGQLIGSARTLNGRHFSMADHRRHYDILGMAPARSRRNTYRLEPQPWDLDVVDMPATNANTAYPDARIKSVDIPSPSRTWRLM